ncbi:MAG TPA: BREX-1 system adenine-specific DNA-methyltransferase PglX, partial [Mollicutes bacterium]|nr:BREX-1 system adenine-specific DNA-methyltransferase PglX [Mollicutes bacterium]
DTEDLYRYLLVKQCNELGKIMPQVFEEISDYTELLLPDNLLGEGSVIRDLVDSVEEEDYKDQVEIIGWMYQYYNQEKRDEIFDSDMSNRRKLVKNDIPAATQIFTPRWIVKFIVQNSLGRFCKENSQYDDLESNWEFYLENDDLRSLCNTNNVDPKNIKVIDPSMGSGHILVYCFDILYGIYIRTGYSEREIPKLILENNLYGLEIDDRASQLAIFSLYMKARSKNRRIFRSSIKLNLCSIQESNYISNDSIEYFINNSDDIRNSMEYLINIFNDAKIYGSILEIDSIKLNLTLLEERLLEIKNEEIKDIFQYQYKDEVIEKIEPLVTQAKVMTQKYHITVTNPPYMGNRRMVDSLKKYANEKYPNAKSDLFAMFIKKSISFTKQNGFIGLVTPFVWWFISSYEDLRKIVLNNTTITSLIQLEYNAFEGATIPVGTFVLRNQKTLTKGEYIKLSDFSGIEMQPLKVLEAIKNPKVYYRYRKNQDNFMQIPGNPIAFWVSDNFISAFSQNKKINDLYETRKGMFTGNNNYFLKKWYEINNNTVGNNFKFYNKGGGYRKWYGNNDTVIRWHNDGYEVKNFKGSGGINESYFYKKCLTWNLVSSTTPFCCRALDENFVMGDAGPVCLINDDNYNYILGFINTNICNYFMNVLNPTLNIPPGVVGKLPIKNSNLYKNRIDEIVSQNIIIAKVDWNSFETSFDFKIHPILLCKETKPISTICQGFDNYRKYTNMQFIQLKSNEEELNRIFIDIYGLADELTPEVVDNDITITKVVEKKTAKDKKNSYVIDKPEVIKSFISYAVGCMFGRYSLDEEGLIYAGGKFDVSRFKTFIPTRDNILVIADDDYFEDDIVSRFVDFVRITFSEETLEENLDYIAESLGQRASETARQTIRRYFLKDFYKDHVKTYQKRPIYWEFTSGKHDGFKALIYMHRYDPYTVSRIRTDYLHKLQRMYEAEVDRIDMYLENSDITPREKSSSLKKKESLLKQIEECLAYDQVIGHVANQKIEIDLDDGVKVNYAKFQGVEVPQGEGRKPLKANLLSKI